VSTDPTAITTEIPVTAAMPPVSAVPVVAPTPTGEAGGQPSATGIEPCPHCGTPLALDQRYCLECGAPRTYLSGMLLERLRSPAAQTSPGQPIQAAAPAGAVGAAAGTLPPSGSPTWQRGSVLTLIAGVGVLLLAMGVGVLIGRSGGSSSAGNAAPQVITVGGAATGAANTTTTPTTPAESPAAKAAAGAAAGAAAAKHKAKEAGVGATPGKPAPPTVLKNLRTGSGQSYEQKSKNLPNVVSTG
jgi:hypothetical protein